MAFKPFRKIAEKIRLMGEENERIQRYTALNTEELRALPEDELISAASARIERILQEKNELMRALFELTDPQRFFYIVRNYETQLEGGGLWQYLADFSYRMAPYLPESLRELGAEEHRALFETFLKENAIDLQDLTRFSTFELRKLEAAEVNPLSGFDAEYRELRPLSCYLTEYIENNIDSF